MKEVYINDILLDLSEKDNPIALTYEVNDLAELKDRQAFTSNNFKVIPTQNNRRACGFPDDGSLIGLQPYRKNNCRIIQDGIEILTNGIALITATDEYINIQALSGIIGFFSELEGKNIRDLYLDAYDHFWNKNTIATSQDYTSGYTYPIINYGNLSKDDKKINAKELRPATFYKTIIDKIIDESGYTYEGNILGDEIFNKLLVPFTNDKFTHGEDYGNTSYSAEARTAKNIDYNSAFNSHIINLPNDNGKDPSNSWEVNEYTAKDIMKVKVTATYDISTRDVYKGGSVPQTIVSIDKFSKGEWVKLVQTIHVTQGEFNTVRFNDQILTVNADLKVGDKIRLQLYYPVTARVRSTIHEGSTLKIEFLNQDVIYGQQIQLAATLPDISQTDFFKNFLQIFGLIVLPNTFVKKIKLISFDDVYKNKPIAKEWTDKFVNGKSKFSYSFGNYGIDNYVRYKNDEGVKPSLGDGKMTFDNLTLKQSVDLFTLKFAASESSNKLSGVTVADIIKVENPLESLEFKKKTEPRILINNKVSVGQLGFFDDEGVITYTDAINTPNFEGLNFDLLFRRYYSKVLRMLYRPIVIDREIKLSAVDIEKLDFSIPIYDEYTSAYYYNNGVRNWIDGETCIISLIKMV